MVTLSKFELDGKDATTSPSDGTTYSQCVWLDSWKSQRLTWLSPCLRLVFDAQLLKFHADIERLLFLEQRLERQIALRDIAYHESPVSPVSMTEEDTGVKAAKLLLKDIRTCTPRQSCLLHEGVI